MIGRRRFLTGLAVTSGTLAAAMATKVEAKPLVKPSGGQHLTPIDLEDALIGSSYLGCGGGGSMAEARALIAEDLANGLIFSMIKANALADDDRVACPYALASLAPMSAEMESALKALPGDPVNPTLASFDLLASYVGKPFAGVILGEIGPLSMAEGLSIAARLGVPALDADTVGRATPEINQHSVRVSGQSLLPAAGVTAFGDEIILSNLKDSSREETIFRKLTDIGAVVGVTDAPITGKIAKAGNTLINDSLTLAMSIGRAVRKATEASEDAIEAARKAGKGVTLFEGRVVDFSWADTDGFLVGSVTIEGHKGSKGSVMQLTYKNEHLLAARDGTIVGTCPDLITMISEDTKEGINNPDFEKGMNVRILGFSSHPLWKTEAGMAVFSPRYFGYDTDFIPVM